jgi:hypothetical protein
MKVLLVNKFFFIKGGAETVYFQERDMLKQAGVQVIDFSMHHDNNLPSTMRIISSAMWTTTREQSAGRYQNGG